MLTRRHIRVKVMQCIYALTQSKDDSLEKQEKFLKVSIENMYTLYLLMLSLLIEIRQLAADRVKLSTKKYMSDRTDEFPDNKKFANNRLLLQLANNGRLKATLEKRKLKDWYLNEEYVKLILKEIVGSKAYLEYMKTPSSSYKDDKELIAVLFKEIIAPNEKIYEYLEDDKLTWVDDIPIVNTFVFKQLKKVKEDQGESYFLPRLLKDDEDMLFAQELLTKTLLNNTQWEIEIEGKTPNWDKDRIADIDSILLKMAICELLNFPSIPEKVTINEFLEIAKEYSTPKSSIFINGILDKLVKEYKSEGKLKKAGRGLL
ncbi:transcription antitermination factor NusB [Maribacter arenosus]|uniref:Transcription antitermination factor NusB n=1 Tax=Maribacter arenosus TaxID=1854708 RepID=A0ABR7VBG5_9FLAO|nr:transcription antitermination factor NusB [Maribacter arenosus]MBD0850972.1 transcription antitermination factor NusB [Maribacter arenosus]